MKKNRLLKIFFCIIQIIELKNFRTSRKISSVVTIINSTQNYCQLSPEIYLSTILNDIGRKPKPSNLQKLEFFPTHHQHSLRSVLEYALSYVHNVRTYSTYGAQIMNKQSALKDN